MICKVEFTLSLEIDVPVEDDEEWEANDRLDRQDPQLVQRMRLMEQARRWRQDPQLLVRHAGPSLAESSLGARNVQGRVAITPESDYSACIEWRGM